SLAHGVRSGLLTVAGTGAGIAVLLGILIAGMAPVMVLVSQWFDWLRLLGAAYLVWLGISKLRDSRRETDEEVASLPRGGGFWQGFVVLLSNPKVLLFLAALLPQFVDPAGNVLAQMIVLGVTFLVVELMGDSVYALAASRAGGLMSRAHKKLIDRLSGVLLIGGGVWLSLVRR
ncbi:MAG TPA: LysE family translocator, partial [Rhizobiales bacterium]|nr:LysE family translocator [Hyphomicrobiales bacterium]